MNIEIIRLRLSINATKPSEISIESDWLILTKGAQ